VTSVAASNPSPALHLAPPPPAGPDPARQAQLDQLREQMQAVQHAAAPARLNHAPLSLTLPWQPGHALPPGSIHEWLVPAPPTSTPRPRPASPPGSTPRSTTASTSSVGRAKPRPTSTQPVFALPLRLMAYWARQAVQAQPHRWVVWVGQAVQPHLAQLPAAVLARSLWLRASRAEDRLWSIDLSLRNPSVSLVIGQADGFDLAATRRLQLACESAQGLALLVHTQPTDTLSAAGSRWCLTPMPPSDDGPLPRPTWRVDLLRLKVPLWHQPLAPDPVRANPATHPAVHPATATATSTPTSHQAGAASTARPHQAPQVGEHYLLELSRDKDIVPVLASLGNGPPQA